MTDYVLVPALERASITDYLNLFHQSFGVDEKFNAQYLEWQYLNNPHGKVIGFDAFFGDVLAAHYVIIPRRYRFGSEYFDAALSLNTATHPKHQGKGLFTKLANATYHEAAFRGVKFIVGAANANSIGGFTRKLGFSELGQIRLYIGGKAPCSFENSLDINIDSAWLEWRLSNPSRKYEYINHNNGFSTLRTWIKNIPFNVGCVETASISSVVIDKAIHANIGLMPGLTPVFSATSPSLFRLPLMMQPSPWHVIWRVLDPNLDTSISKHLRLDGLSMDTF